MTKQLSTAREVAQALSVSTHTVMEWARQGLIPRVRLSRKSIRFDLDEVLAVVRRRQKG
jgi:excisionase family DNA binding protein